MRTKLARKAQRFIADFGMWLHTYGLPPAAGQVLAWLTVCGPPHQTARDIAEAVGSSLGTISSATRLLKQAGFVERFSMPGERATYFRIRQVCWRVHLCERACAFITRLQESADRGLKLLGDEPPQLHRRLEAMEDTSASFRREFTKLFDLFEMNRQ